MTPGDYVLSVLRQFSDNEMSCADLVNWEGNVQKFEKVAIYNALAHLYGTGKIVKQTEGRSTWWAIALEGPKASSRSKGSSRDASKGAA